MGQCGIAALRHPVEGEHFVAEYPDAAESEADFVDRLGAALAPTFRAAEPPGREDGEDVHHMRWAGTTDPGAPGAAPPHGHARRAGKDVCGRRSPNRGRRHHPGTPRPRPPHPAGCTRHRARRSGPPPPAHRSPARPGTRTTAGNGGPQRAHQADSPTHTG
ncbi:hypothetical protein STXM2123_549 [Streptomyces sp. F-3]|nr:hypothetical protein STXM2123_549 [Streptomyces sp. F-3]